MDPAAQLGEGVRVGPYAVVGPDVQIGAGTCIGPHVVLDGRVRLGRDNHVFAGACIGQEPQDLKYTGDSTEVVIGDGNRIREYVTINRATAGDEQTILGDGNLLMAYSHIGHNCRLGNRIVIANGVAVIAIVVAIYGFLPGAASHCLCCVFWHRALQAHLTLCCDDAHFE